MKQELSYPLDVDFGPSSSMIRGLHKAYGSGMEVWRHSGIIIPVMGGDQNFGYNETADIPIKTVDGVPLNQLYAEIQETLRILNRMRRPLIDRLSFPIDREYEEVPQLQGDEFEEADEFGQPKGIRPGPKWNMGYDMRYYDIAIRFTFRYLGMATAAEVRQLANQALEADERLIYQKVMERIFRNVTDEHTLTSGNPVNVYPFYNGSNPVAPPTWKTFSHSDTHDHYLVSNGATVDSGDLDEMYDHIKHHGYHLGADIILLVNSQESATIAGFRVANGDRWDFIPGAGGPSFIVEGQIVGGLQPGKGLAGLDGYLGRYGRIQVIEEDYIPAGYMFMFASGGEKAERNPVALRQHPNPGLRGLKLIPRFERYPLVESFYHHALGSGVRHRGAGVVMQVKASGNYEIPTIESQGPGGR